MTRAGFFARFLAIIIDSLAIGVVGSILAWLGSLFTGGEGGLLGMMAAASSRSLAPDGGRE